MIGSNTEDDASTGDDVWTIAGTGAVGSAIVVFGIDAVGGVCSIIGAGDLSDANTTDDVCGLCMCAISKLDVD
jgi:hypothetical protein